MEKAGYRENLARLDAAFPGRELLTRKDVAGLFGVDMGTLRRMNIQFNMNTRRISKADLARAICNGAR